MRVRLFRKKAATSPDEHSQAEKRDSAHDGDARTHSGAGHWCDAGAAADIAPESAIVLEPAVTGLDAPIAVFRTEDDEFYCIDDTCTHEDASLAEGWVEGCEVECPVHVAAFCLKTGDALTPPASAPVRTYPVRLNDGHVWVLLGE
ncbi:bifunctional 3-phenylpropionate/cinnamic acid dioxygenase ferredoxin subunit [Corynebacterium sp. TAE3-ERU30]|nr:bifunctional 3-phenylpropionate/cinnamic acid dioxygenase ferredoxin subunit [Corynebacterium sp. TAE3-ERU30]